MSNRLITRTSSSGDVCWGRRLSQQKVFFTIKVNWFVNFKLVFGEQAENFSYIPLAFLRPRIADAPRDCPALFACSPANQVASSTLRVSIDSARKWLKLFSLSLNCCIVMKRHFRCPLVYPPNKLHKRVFFGEKSITKSYKRKRLGMLWRSAKIKCIMRKFSFFYLSLLLFELQFWKFCRGWRRQAKEKVFLAFAVNKTAINLVCW